jgi:hypothetical protein
MFEPERSNPIMENFKNERTTVIKYKKLFQNFQAVLDQVYKLFLKLKIQIELARTSNFKKINFKILFIEQNEQKKYLVT